LEPWSYTYWAKLECILGKDLPAVAFGKALSKKVLLCSANSLIVLASSTLTWVCFGSLGGIHFDGDGNETYT